MENRGRVPRADGGIALRGGHAGLPQGGFVRGQRGGGGGQRAGGGGGGGGGGAWGGGGGDDAAPAGGEGEAVRADARCGTGRASPQLGRQDQHAQDQEAPAAPTDQEQNQTDQRQESASVNCPLTRRGQEGTSVQIPGAQSALITP